MELIEQIVGSEIYHQAHPSYIVGLAEVMMRFDGANAICKVGKPCVSESGQVVCIPKRYKCNAKDENREINQIQAQSLGEILKTAALVGAASIGASALLGARNARQSPEEAPYIERSRGYDDESRASEREKEAFQSVLGTPATLLGTAIGTALTAGASGAVEAITKKVHKDIKQTVMRNVANVYTKTSDNVETAVTNAGQSATPTPTPTPTPPPPPEEPEESATPTPTPTPTPPPPTEESVTPTPTPTPPTESLDIPTPTPKEKTQAKNASMQLDDQEIFRFSYNESKKAPLHHKLDLIIYDLNQPRTSEQEEASRRDKVDKYRAIQKILEQKIMEGSKLDPNQKAQIIAEINADFEETRNRYKRYFRSGRSADTPSSPQPTPRVTPKPKLKPKPRQDSIVEPRSLKGVLFS